MKSSRRMYERGEINGWMMSTIGLIVLVIATAAFAIWAYVNYDDYKTNTDSKIAIAEAEARKEQADEDEARYAELEKEPRLEFVGPDDYGRLTFLYPKTWSVYVGSDISSGGTYRAYLNSIVVPPVSDSQQFALRVTIENESYDRVVSGYQRQIQRGELTSSSISVNGKNGTRLDGSFSTNIRGSAVIFRIRDKTLTMRTDADTFRPDFDTIIQTIDFNE